MAKSIENPVFLGEADIPFGSAFAGQAIGGLSAITYDARRDVYYALSDDRSANARFFTLKIALGDGALENGDVGFAAVTRLSDEAGQPFAANTLDPEGLVLGRNGALYLSSEGDASQLIAPFVDRFGLDGRQQAEFAIPERFLPTADQSSGIRNNLAFEGLTVTPNGKTIFVGTEDALYQDGPNATLDAGSPSRILQYDARTGQETAEYVYVTDPISAPPVPATQFATNGLVELLALDNKGTLVAMERSFSTGVGNDIKLYLVDTRDATDVSGLDSLQGADYVPVAKTLLFDLAEFGIVPDNVEGLTLGPRLADGRQTLVLVADDNFSPTQVTQVLAFAVDIGRHGAEAAHDHLW